MEAIHRAQAVLVAEALVQVLVAVVVVEALVLVVLVLVAQAVQMIPQRKVRKAFIIRFVNNKHTIK